MSGYRPPEHPRREPSFPGISTAQLGMYVGLASLTMIFGASLVAYFVTRAQNSTWRTSEMPELPSGLLVSTLLLVGLSLSLRYGERRLRKNNQAGLMRGLSGGAGLALAFLLAQIQNWRMVAATALDADLKNLYVFTFYMLTALHALHVLGGLGPLAWVMNRARKQEYSSSNNEGVRLTRQYWDYLLVVWVILLVSLKLAN